jgi:hypothetical protein
MPLFTAVFAASIIGGPLWGVEKMASDRLYRFRLWTFYAVLFMACVFSFTAESVAAGADDGVIFVRSVLIWSGLSVLSGRLFGPQQSWILPLMSAFPLVWLSDESWWDWTAACVFDGTSWLFAVSSLAIGTFSLWLTPWRVRKMCRW